MTTRRIAYIISFVFHPVILSLLLPFIVIYDQFDSIRYGIKWTLFSGLFITLALFAFFFARPVDVLTDIDISTREKRPVFYAIALLFAVLFFGISVLLKGIFFPLSLISLGIIIGIVLFECVNFFLKASIHMAVSVAATITIGALYGVYAGVACLLVPFAMAWSRLYLKKHTLSEVIVGSILGAAVTYLTIWISTVI